MKKRHNIIICCVAIAVLLCSCSKNKEITNPSENSVEKETTVEATTTQVLQETTPESLPEGLEKLENIPDNVQLTDDTETIEAEKSVSDSIENEADEKAEKDKDQNSASEPTDENEGKQDEADGKNDVCCEYMIYLSKSANEQQEYMGTFTSPMAFIEWCKAAEAEHAAHVTVIEAPDGEINIADYIQ